MLLGKSDAFTLKPSARKSDHEIVYFHQVNPCLKRFLVIDRCKLTMTIETSDCGWLDGMKPVHVSFEKIQNIVHNEPTILILHSLLRGKEERVFAVDPSPT